MRSLGRADLPGDFVNEIGQKQTFKKRSPAKLTLWSVSMSGDLEDGHFLFAFVAKETKSNISIAAVPQATLKHTYHFHGCEVGKVD